MRKTNAFGDGKMLQYHLPTNHISARSPYTVEYSNYAWDQCWDLQEGCKGLKFGGGDASRLLRDRPAGGAAIGGENICGDIGARVVGGAVVGVGDNARRGTRVSLSDWLAFQARIRGSKAPRLLRDRPTDGAAIGCGN